MPTTLALYHLTVFAVLLTADEPPSDFNGLGRKLLGGFALAVVAAVAYAFIKLRWRDRNPPAKFISITAADESPERSRD
jgi:hypothetical protein